MSFIRRKGQTKALWFPKTASTAFTDGALVTLSSGYLIPCTSTTASVVGVCRKAVAATDSDYASTTSIPVEVPVEPSVEYEALTASATAANVGGSYDLTDSVTVNLSGSTYKIVNVVSVISATKVAVTLNTVYTLYA